MKDERFSDLLQVRIGPKDRARIERLSAEMGCSLSAAVRRALQELEERQPTPLAASAAPEAS